MRIIMDKYINIYRYPENNVTAKPLSAKREWLKNSNGLHCPPMMLANTLGWYYGLEEDITFNWNGEMMPGSVKITNTKTGDPVHNSIANNNFGEGVVTFGGTRGFFETTEGYSLLLSGPTNMWIDGIHPCTGIVETDWSAFPFTMNWKMTMINQDILIPKDYPVMCFIPIKITDFEEFKIEYKDAEKWEKIDQINVFSQNRSKDGVVKENDETHGLYLNGKNAYGEKIKERNKLFRLFR
jgi:hypothetical protein